MSTCFWFNVSHSRAGLLICFYLMDRKEVDIEEAILVFNKLAGPEADPTKDLYRKGLRDRHMNRHPPSSIYGHLTKEGELFRKRLLAPRDNQ